MTQTAYSKLWGVVEGAVADAFNRHPDYLTSKGKRSAATSVIKRVTGTVLSFAVQETARSRQQPAETDQAYFSSEPQEDGVCDVIRVHSFAHVNERCYQAVRRALFPVGARAVRRDARRFQRAFEAMTAQLERELGLSRAIQARVRRISVGPIATKFEFCPPDGRRRDRDNLIASMKAATDGIADALGIDDSNFISTYSMGGPVKGGAVLVTIGSTA